MNEQHHDDHTHAVFVPTAGAKLAQYTIEKKLGVGGMGEVYLAKDNTLGRQVALKFLSAKLADDKTFRARFIREARAAAALNHPNVVTIYEVAERNDGLVYIAMEFVSGRSLQDIFAESRPPLDSLCEIMLQVCDGIGSAHQLGMVHRDIKPANIIVGDDRRVRILDFGLAKAEEDEQITQAGMAMGTVNYMAPEQARGEDTDARSDVFAIGIVLYEALTGKQPFRRGNGMATMQAVINEPPPPISETRNDVPKPLENLVLKALSKKPSERFATALDLGREIRGLLGVSQAGNITGLPSGRSSQTGTFGITSMVGRAAAGLSRSVAVQALAILYLRNLGSEEDEFLSYGITEDLIVDLTRVGTVRVAPMRSILKYKDSDAELEDIAAKLNVNFVLDGSIHRAADRIRVSAQLVDVGSGDNLWAGRWEKGVDDLPQIKQDLASGVVEALNIGASVVSAAQVGTPEASDHQAYEAYLKGKYSFELKKDSSDVEIALGLYRQALKQEPGLLAARAGIAEIHIHRGENERAEEELKSALEEAREREARADQVRILLLLARLHIRQSNWKIAWVHAKEASELTRELRDLAGEADTLGCQIAILQPQAKFDEALRLFDRVLEISRKLNDPERIGEALKNMGVVYARKGDFDRALSLYQEALALAEKQENLSLQAACNSNIGNVHYFKGELDEAYECYHHALQIHSRLGDPAMAARPKLNMGLIELMRGKHTQGLDHLNEAADAFKELGERSTFAMTLMNISHVRLTLGETELATKSAERALAIAQEINHPLAESDAILRLANVYLYERDFDHARKLAEQALEISTAAGLSRNIAWGHLILADIHALLHEYDQCQKAAKEAQATAKEIGDKAVAAKATALLAYLTAREGMYFAGLRQLEQLLTKSGDIADTQQQLQVRTLYGQTLVELGKSDEDKLKGTTVLKQALQLARDRQQFPEARRIEEVLAESDQDQTS